MSKDAIQRDPDDDYPDDDWYFDDFTDDRDTCDACGGEGFVEYLDCPAVWGEDCPSEVNHLVACPECGGTGTAT